MNSRLTHNYYRLWLPWLLVGVILACNMPTPQTPVPMVTSMPAWSSPYPTYTPYPTSDEVSNSPTPCQPSITATADVNVRKGPSKAYDIVGTLTAGESANVLGRSESQFGEWWYIQYSAGSDGHGWVWGASTSATCIPSELQVVAAPPVSNVNAAQSPTKKPPLVITDTPDPGTLLIDHLELMKVSDIEVLKVNADSSGGVSVDIRNNGPVEFDGQVHVVCIATGSIRSAPQNQTPFVSDENIDIDISVGTGFFPTSLKLNTATYSYPSIHCTVVVPNDPNPNNNAGATALP